MTPTTDDQDKYEEQHSEDAEPRNAQLLWDFIFNLVGVVVAGILVAALIIVLMR